MTYPYFYMLRQNLAEIKGLSDAKIDKMVEAARKCDTRSGWQTAASVEKQVHKALCVECAQSPA